MKITEGMQMRAECPAVQGASVERKGASKAAAAVCVTTLPAMFAMAQFQVTCWETTRMQPLGL
eukprot:360675-Chlamydomonas_euryale.AAC.1